MAPHLQFPGSSMPPQSPSGPSSEPGSRVSSPSSSPLPQRHHHLHDHHHPLPHPQDGYSSLERLNRRPRVDKTSLEKLHHWRMSLDREPCCSPAPWGSEGGGCRGKEEEEEEEEEADQGGEQDQGEEDEGGVAEGDSTFVRNRKERSTVLVRRFFKNNQKVIDRTNNIFSTSKSFCCSLVLVFTSFTHISYTHVLVGLCFPQENPLFVH